MANIERPRAALGAYTTTYNKDYVPVVTSTTAYRPRTNRGFQAGRNLGEPVGDTTYQTEYERRPQPWHDSSLNLLQKYAAKPEPLRSGSASGNRRNNPHPSKPFMVWRIKANEPGGAQDNSNVIPISDQLLDEVMRGKLRSTYQADYLGVPQGIRMKSVFTTLQNGTEDPNASVPYSYDSFQRHVYRKPRQCEELKSTTSRYAANTDKNKSAYGAAPAISARHLNLNETTQYSREFNAPVRYTGLYQVRDVGRTLGAQALSNHLNGAGKDAAELEEIYNNMLSPVHRDVTSAGSGRASSTRRHNVPMATRITTPPAAINYVSEWTGPI